MHCIPHRLHTVLAGPSLGCTTPAITCGQTADALMLATAYLYCMVAFDQRGRSLFSTASGWCVPARASEGTVMSKHCCNTHVKAAAQLQVRYGCCISYALLCCDGQHLVSCTCCGSKYASCLTDTITGWLYSSFDACRCAIQ
jgi:flavoprotein